MTASQNALSREGKRENTPFCSLSMGHCLSLCFRLGHMGTLGPSWKYPGRCQTRRAALTLSMGLLGRVQEKLTRKQACRKPSEGTARLLGKRGLSESFQVIFAPIWWLLEVNKVELIKHLAQCLAQNSFPFCILIITSHIFRVYLDFGYSENSITSFPVFR